MLQSQVSFLSLLAATTAAFGTILSLSSAPALADSFNFDYSGAGITASGVLTTTSFDPSIGGYLITDVTGQRNGTSISMLLPPNTFAGNDNLLFATSPYLDGAGWAYEAGGGTYYDAFSIAPGGYFEQSSQTPSAATSLTSFIITPSSPPPPTPVPEPSEAMAIVVMGVWIDAAWRLRKKKSVSSQRV